MSDSQRIFKGRTEAPHQVLQLSEGSLCAFYDALSATETLWLGIQNQPRVKDLELHVFDAETGRCSDWLDHIADEALRRIMPEGDLNSSLGQVVTRHLARLYYAEPAVIVDVLYQLAEKRKAHIASLKPSTEAAAS